MMDEVAIVSPPESGFVVRGRPFPLSCTAINAKRIRFKCGQKWVSMDFSRLALSASCSSPSPSPCCFPPRLEGRRRAEGPLLSHFEPFCWRLYDRDEELQMDESRQENESGVDENSKLPSLTSTLLISRNEVSFFSWKTLFRWN